MTILLIWSIGLVLTLRAIIEICQLNVPANKRFIAITIVILTSWFGAFFYTFYAKDRMHTWLKCTMITYH
ncbi:MAG: hypothetical protein LUE99_06920 [Bacteroides sp.]|nr:hypothetical protein [Bacteroides sp.]